jgi:hypothetical protein
MMKFNKHQKDYFQVFMEVIAENLKQKIEKQYKT